MPRTHGANKSNWFAQILNPYEVTLSEFAQVNDGLFEQIRPELLHTDLKFEQIKSIYLLHVNEALVSFTAYRFD